MAIKLIALDLDGTLLTSDKRLTDRTKQVLSACVDRGITIIPATGRTRAGLPGKVRALPGVRYAITSNGAVIQDLETEQRIGGCSIGWQEAAALLQMIDPYPIMYDAYIGSRGKSEERFLNSLEDYDLRPEVCLMIRSTRDTVADLRSYIEETQCGVDKINLTFKTKDLKAGLRQKMRELLEKRGSVLVTSSMPFNLELNALGATKGSGLEFIAEYLHLKKEETLAFGDGENDLPMLRAAGLGIAMANGAPFLREQADGVTASNDEDGVAAAIEKLVLAHSGE